MRGDATADITGNLTSDPQKTYSSAGNPITKFTLAVNRKKKVGDEWKDNVQFFDIVCFGALADSANKNLSKGKPVRVKGNLDQNRWDAPDGSKRSKISIIADPWGVHYLFNKSPDSKQDDDVAPKEDKEEVPEGEVPPISDEDVPE